MARNHLVCVITAVAALEAQVAESERLGTSSKRLNTQESLIYAVRASNTTCDGDEGGSEMSRAKSLRGLGAAGLSALAVLSSVGVAHADSNDDQFLLGVNNIGITGAPADLISNARLICAGLDDGSNPDQIINAVATQLGFRPDRAATFTALSVTHYCPQYGNMRVGQNY